MKKKPIIIAVASIALLTLVYQGTLAIFHEETNVSAQMSAGKLGIELVDSSNDKTAVLTDEGFVFEAAMPGSTLQRAIKVDNVKDKDLYVRITVKKYWDDAEGKKMVDAKADYISILTKKQGNWIILDKGATSNSEEFEFYYKRPLAPGESSDNVMDGIVLSTAMKESMYRNYHAVIEVKAEAIQKIGAKDAILTEWGIEANIDNNGNLQSIED